MKDSKFWQALRFALQCAPECEKGRSRPDEQVREKIHTQSKYSWEDVAYVMFPILDRYDYVVSSCSYITGEGIEALACLDRGETPHLPNEWKVDKSTLLRDIKRRAEDVYVDMNDVLDTDQEGYVALCIAMCELNRLSSAYVGYEVYLWKQVHLILQGQDVAVRDILSPLFTSNDVLKLFLAKHVALGEEHFNRILDYAERIRPMA